MNDFNRTWIAPAVAGNHALCWCAAWFMLLALLAFVAAFLESGAFDLTIGFALGGLYAFAALGLLRGLKSGWHVAAFLAFANIVFRIVAVGCAPGEIAVGERHLLQAAFDILMLALAVLVFNRLRRPDVRRLYGVPQSYAASSDASD